VHLYLQVGLPPTPDTLAVLLPHRGQKEINAQTQGVKRLAPLKRLQDPAAAHRTRWDSGHDLCDCVA